jgi:hypothetical protein
MQADYTRGSGFPKPPCDRIQTVIIALEVVATTNLSFNSSWALGFVGEKPTPRKALAVASFISTTFPPIGGPHEGRQRVFHQTANEARKGTFL